MGETHAPTQRCCSYGTNSTTREHTKHATWSRRPKILTEQSGLCASSTWQAEHHPSHRKSVIIDDLSQNGYGGGGGGGRREVGREGRRGVGRGVGRGEERGEVGEEEEGRWERKRRRRVGGGGSVSLITESGHDSAHSSVNGERLSRQPRQHLVSDIKSFPWSIHTSGVSRVWHAVGVRARLAVPSLLTGCSVVAETIEDLAHKGHCVSWPKKAMLRSRSFQIRVTCSMDLMTVEGVPASLQWPVASECPACVRHTSWSSGSGCASSRLCAMLRRRGWCRTPA